MSSLDRRHSLDTAPPRVNVSLNAGIDALGVDTQAHDYPWFVPVAKNWALERYLMCYGNAAGCGHGEKLSMVLSTHMSIIFQPMSVRTLTSSRLVVAHAVRMSKSQGEERCL